MAEEKLRQARALIQNKQYEQARQLLRSMDHPTAKQWLEKLDRRTPSKLNNKNSLNSSWAYIMVGSTMGLLGILIGVFLGLKVLQPQAASVMLPTQAVLPSSVSTSTPDQSLTGTAAVMISSTMNVQLTATQTFYDQSQTKTVMAVEARSTLPPTWTPTRDIESASTGKWQFDTQVSGFSDTASYYIFLEAESPIQGFLNEEYPVLGIACIPGRYTLAVVTNVQIDIDFDIDADEAEAMIRLDRDRAESILMTRGDSGDVLFFRNPNSRIRELTQHDTLLFGFTPFTDPFTETSFDLTGLSEAMKPLKEACGNL